MIRSIIIPVRGGAGGILREVSRLFRSYYPDSSIANDGNVWLAYDLPGLCDSIHKANDTYAEAHYLDEEEMYLTLRELPYFENSTWVIIVCGYYSMASGHYFLSWGMGTPYVLTYLKTLGPLAANWLIMRFFIYYLRMNPVVLCGSLVRGASDHLLFWTTHQYLILPAEEIYSWYSYRTIHILYCRGLRVRELISLAPLDIHIESRSCWQLNLIFGYR